MRVVGTNVNVASRNHKNCRARLWIAPIERRSYIRYANIFWILLPMFVCVTNVWATTIVTYRGPNGILVAADSSLTIIGPTGEISFAQVCKIQPMNGGVLVAIGGYTGDFAWQDAADATEQGGTLKEIADQFQARVIVPLTAELKSVQHKLHRVPLPTDGYGLIVVFAKIEQSTPVVMVRGFRVDVAKNNITIHTQDFTCPGNVCPNGFGTGIYGQGDAANRWLVDHPDCGSKEAGGGTACIRELVQSEIDASKDHSVGPPISIFGLDANLGIVPLQPGSCQNELRRNQ